MSPAFVAPIGKTFEQANVTIDWLPRSRGVTKTIGNMSKAEAKHNTMPKPDVSDNGPEFTNWFGNGLEGCV